MNKVISTKDRVFMSLVGPSGCGKSYLIFQMLKNGTFYPMYDKVLYFYQYYQDVYSEMLKEIDNIEFIQNVDFDLIENLPSDGTNYMLIFDDSCEEICKSTHFNKLATAGRHKNLSCIYVKHNLFHKGSIGRDAELQNTHIILFKSPRDVQQIKVLGSQLGMGEQLKEWYESATRIPYGYLMIDLNPRTPEYLRYCSDSASFPAMFLLPTSRARITRVDDRSAELLYSKALSRLQSLPPTDIHTELSKRIYQVLV